jgi:small subunit ribosomal protein S16
VVTDSRSPRDGRFIEAIGIYDPRHEHEAINLARADKWVSKGALPSDVVRGIMKRARAGLVIDTSAAKAAPADGVAPAAATRPGEGV